MNVVRWRLEPGSLPVGRIDTLRVDATTEEQIAAQAAADEADARIESARLARQVRERFGLSQKDFSRRILVSVDTIRRWERGSTAPSGTALALLRLLDRLPRSVVEGL